MRKHVLSNKGFLWHFITLILSIAALSFFWFFIQALVNSSPIFEVLFFGAFTAFFGFAALELLTQRVKVDIEKLTIRSIFQNKQLLHKDVRLAQEIGVLERSRLEVYTEYNRQSIRGVSISGMYANSDELARAIIEIVSRNNPAAEISPKLLQNYGVPPYGIFEDVNKNQS